MRLRQNLVRARGHIVFILGVIGGLMVVTWLEQAGPSAAGQAPVTPLAAIEAATPLPLIVEQHTRIVDAIEAGNPTEAAAAMRTHLREIIVSLPEIAARFPDDFE